MRLGCKDYGQWSTSGASNMSLNVIEIEMRDVYGVTKFYPVCERSQIFAKIAGTVTLTKETIKHIKSLD